MHNRQKIFHLNDSLEPLANLWRGIIDNPLEIASQYEETWSRQKGDPQFYYRLVREAFNRDQDPVLFLFLLARCVKNAVRFNSFGEFNQSPDLRRRGTDPERMRQSILGASRLLQGRSLVTAGDYASAIEGATSQDLVYLDPPYQGTSGERDQRYHQQLYLDRLIADLDRLLTRGVPVIVSFDGRSGDQSYGQDLPASLGLSKIELRAGRSAQATLNGLDVDTVESLYMSPELLPLHEPTMFDILDELGLEDE